MIAEQSPIIILGNACQSSDRHLGASAFLCSLGSLLFQSVFICLPRRSIAKAGVHPWLKSSRLTPANLFAKRTQIEKFLTSCLSIRNEIFRANLAQKTNPKRTHFLSRLSRSSTHLRFESFFGAWRLVLGIFAIFQIPASFGFGSVCERLIKFENSLVRTFHRPVTDQKSGPKIRGYKPKSNRHKLKNSPRFSTDSGWRLSIGTLMRCWLKFVSIRAKGFDPFPAKNSLRVCQIG
jgi:hypothetical protein